MEQDHPLLDSIVGKTLEFLIAVVPWSLAVYAFWTSVHPFPDSVVSHIFYWGFFGLIFAIWLFLFNGFASTRRVRIHPGVIEEMTTRLGVLRFRREYICESRDEIVMKYLSGTPSGRFYVFLVRGNGTEIMLERFAEQKEAADYCAKAQSLFMETGPSSQPY